MKKQIENFCGSMAYLGVFLRWLLLASLMGLLCGVVGSFFHMAVNWATTTRGSHSWFVYLLPMAGLLIAGLYRFTGTEGEGTNNIINTIHFGEKVPILLVPVIFLSTALTHVFGGSAGREGAALQIGGGLGYKVGRLLKLDDKNTRLITLCGMSALFSALFGTPLTATVFVLEVISVGIIHYAGLVPCLTASLVAFGVSVFFGLEPTRFAFVVQPLELGMLLKVAVLALLCSQVSIIFCIMLHKTEHLAAEKIKNSFVRAFVGGCIIIVLTKLLGTQDYNGAGEHVLSSALSGGPVPAMAFFWKMVFTAVTIGFGFKGGEIVPTFFVGATLGCVLASLLGIPAELAAAIGLVAVFCGAVNCPLASIILSIELFGSGALCYFALACGISYMLSGYFGLYSSQKIVYSKTRTEFVDRFAI